MLDEIPDSPGLREELATTSRRLKVVAFWTGVALALAVIALVWATLLLDNIRSAT